ncbi:MAG: hypothetical protein E6R09_06865 [Rhodocyclaceae bacterium]|nr:MAG: hypothetical protein E6R09_06865 [Rhodocyclaceae bacterium]
MIRSTENAPTSSDIQRVQQPDSLPETPSNGVPVIHNGLRYHWFEEEPAEIIDNLYCVARLGADGVVIPGSRLSGDFSSPGAVCSACDELRKRYPDAAVFGSLIVDRLAAHS